MVTSLRKQGALSLQLELAVTLNKIDSVNVSLIGELTPFEREWYRTRLGELTFYQNRLIAELGDRGEEIDVRRD